MFSPIGKKKILLQIKRAKEMGVKDPLATVMERVGSPTKQHGAGSPSPPRARPASAGGGVVGSSAGVISTSKLEKLLADKGLDGVVTKRIMESTVRYNPSTDGVVLKAFQSRNISHELFRNYLRSAFWLSFTEEEYARVVGIFDPTNTGLVDGYQFMIAFIRLGGIRKDRFGAEVREKQDNFLLTQKADADRKLREAEKKNEIAADFDFDSSVRETALKKLALAAKKFDPGHPSSPSLEAFTGKYMSPAVLREMLKRVFNLRVTSKELGAILKSFDEKEEAAAAQANQFPSSTSKATAEAEAAAALVGEGAADKPVQVSCNDFLRHFFRLGIEGRDREKAEQRRRQAMLDKLAAEEAERKLHEAENKMSLAVDYDFSAVDEARANEKIKQASTKYDRNAPGCQSLDGFECESLSAGAFRDLLRRTFNLVLTNKELGYLVRKHDKTGTGRVTCTPFITAFLRIGQEERHAHHVKQLEKQRRLDALAEQEHLQKMKAVQEGGGKELKISYDFTDNDLQSARAKLTEAAVFFDRARGGSLSSFEALSLSPLEFKRALKRTFNITLSPTELGALICTLDKEGKGVVECQVFLNAFSAMGFSERGKLHMEQLTKSREAEKRMVEEAEKKRLDMLNSSDVAIDFEFTDVERDEALSKMTTAATKYDKSHPSAMSLDGFQCKDMTPIAFKELVRRTFGLKLKPKEVGALVRHFDKTGENVVDCSEFLTVFLQLGYNERAKMHKAQIERQREENKARIEEDQAKLKKTTERASGNIIDMNYGESDGSSAMSKLLIASEGYDKNHPAAPSLSAFEALDMTPGIFKENLKRCFNIRLTPKELGFLLTTYGNVKENSIKATEFLTKFLIIGNTARYEKHRKFLEKQRKAIKAAKKEEEDKLTAQFEKAELQVDLKDFAEADMDSAMEKMKAASAKFDKSHPAAPSLTGFTGGAMKPGEFRELVRRTFNLWLTPKELAAIVDAFSFDPPEKKSGKLDSKLFLIRFMKLGHEARAQMKATALEKQRQSEQEMAQEKLRKQRILEQKMVTDIDNEFGEVDRTSVYTKLTASSAKYDKSAPGCVSLDAFDAAFLTPLVFREVVKRTFNIALAPKELACLISDFDNGSGNVDCQNFVISFIKLGAEERNKFKLIQLEKQRQNDHIRKTEHVRKMKEAEDKMTLKVSYDFSPEEKELAFIKLAAAAKKYDKNAPGCQGLDGFDAKTLGAAVFREMLKRTFGLVLGPGELGAVMSYFDKNKTGSVTSHEFLIHFLKVGQSEREKDRIQTLKQLRKDAAERKKMEEEALAAMWAKTELKVTQTYTGQERESALEKLAHSAFMFDPASPGPMGLTAFQASHLSPAVFREMLKRSFNMRVTDAELAALIDEFEQEPGNKQVDCAEFMVTFTQLGFEKRSEARLAQLEKNRAAELAAKQEHAEKKKAADEKMTGVSDYSFAKEDFNSALDKIRTIAGNYDRGHPSSPSLQGFMGANMLPFEFKDMLMRTFHVSLTGKELGALVKFFDTANDNTINAQEFLAHFFKLQRQEQERKRRAHIRKERDLKNSIREVEASKDKVKAAEESQKLRFTRDDQVSFLKKLRNAAQEYAVDSAALQEPLQAFKGPALTPLAFRDIFGRIFLRMPKFTFPEMGVLLSLLDTAGTGTLDGPRFLNWFYKIGRREGRIMLGEAPDDVNLDNLGATGEATLESFNNNSSSHAATNNNKASKKSPLSPSAGGKEKGGTGSGSAAAAAAAAAAAERGDEDFTVSTLNQQWILPSSTEAQAGIGSGGAGSDGAGGTGEEFEPFALPSGGNNSNKNSGNNSNKVSFSSEAKGNAAAPFKSLASTTPGASKQHKSSSSSSLASSKDLNKPGKISKGTQSEGGFFFPSLLVSVSGSASVSNIAPVNTRDFF